MASTDPKPTKKTLKDDANVIRGKSQSYNIPGQLPIYLTAHSPHYGDITWVCGVNEDGVIRGITRCTGSNEHQVSDFATPAEAFEMREYLMTDHGDPTIVRFFEAASPELVFNQKDSEGNVVAPNRKQARKVARKLRRGKVKN
jgi:hypothetical protein